MVKQNRSTPQANKEWKPFSKHASARTKMLMFIENQVCDFRHTGQTFAAYRLIEYLRMLIVKKLFEIHLSDHERRIYIHPIYHEIFYFISFVNCKRIKNLILRKTLRENHQHAQKTRQLSPNEYFNFICDDESISDDDGPNLFRPLTTRRLLSRHTLYIFIGVWLLLCHRKHLTCFEFRLCTSWASRGI